MSTHAAYVKKHADNQEAQYALYVANRKRSASVDLRCDSAALQRTLLSAAKYLAANEFIRIQNSGDCNSAQYFRVAQRFGPLLPEQLCL
jgi:hypothetical protein